MKGLETKLNKVITKQNADRAKHENEIKGMSKEIKNLKEQNAILKQKIEPLTAENTRLRESLQQLQLQLEQE